MIIVLGIVSCEKSKDDNPKRQLVYFEFYEISYAWGFSYAHWIIDNEGNIRINHNPDSIFSINVAKIDSCLSYFDSTVYKVESSEFKKYSSLIQPAFLGGFDCKLFGPTDHGEYGYYCFRDHTYIVLKTLIGETLCSNNDSSAIKISNWLRDINVKLNTKKSLPAANKQ
jgi:hypothetical protein